MPYCTHWKTCKLRGRRQLENLVSLRHAMDFKVYVEKVETAFELVILKELGVDRAPEFCIADAWTTTLVAAAPRNGFVGIR